MFLLSLLQQLLRSPHLAPDAEF
ncbi:hypothetical protein LINGRAHAP2_LOCUS17917 [Linum grandiflorum]